VVGPAVKNLGVKAGDRIALVLPNCPQHLIAFHSVLRLGVVEDHGAGVAVVWDKMVDRVLPWRRLFDAGELKKRHPRPASEDLAVLQCTSGTTGAPKGAMLTHANLANAAQGRAWVPGLKDGRETVYAVLPMFHAYGLTLCMTFALSVGARLVLFPKFDVGFVLKAHRKSPETFLPAVPPIYDRLAVAAARQGVSLEGIRFSISGAMNLPASTVETWENATGGYLIEGYGLTETSPIAVGNPFGPSRKPGTVGVWSACPGQAAAKTSWRQSLRPREAPSTPRPSRSSRGAISRPTKSPGASWCWTCSRAP
jgi:acyl-CoA synthetase (AMP-forming)/AMP-acid ligase II